MTSPRNYNELVEHGRQLDPITFLIENIRVSNVHTSFIISFVHFYYSSLSLDKSLSSTYCVILIRITTDSIDFKLALSKSDSFLHFYSLFCLHH